MILVNLLPPQFRRRERPSLRFVGALAAFAALDCAAFAWAGWLHFHVHAGIDGELASLDETVDGMRPRLDYYEALERESKQFRARETMLESVNAGRICWTQKIDALLDVVNRGGDQEKYLVWLDDLLVSQTSKRKGSSGSLHASGHSGSDNFALVANFFDDLKASPFIEGFEDPAPPEGSTSEVDEDLVPDKCWSFGLQLELKPNAQAEAPVKPKPKPKPANAEPKE
jgi:Tfp pilus assembly protein PilN